VNGFHHGSQFDFYLKGRILESSKRDSRENIMSAIIEFFRSLFHAPVPALARSGQADLRTLYQLSRGRDSVSPAVLRKLADAAK
jgi:hypothetical protein